MMEIISENSFKELLQKDELSICTFYTDTCPNCKTIESIFDKILLEKSINCYKIYAINSSDLNKGKNKLIDFAVENKIMGVPTTLFFRYGMLMDKKLGVKSKSNFLKSIEKFENFTHEEAIEYNKKGFFSKLFGI